MADPIVFVYVRCAGIRVKRGGFVPVHVIARRFMAGCSPLGLARAYGCTRATIEAAIRWSGRNPAKP